MHCKDETTFETAKHTQTMAPEKLAIRTSKDFLHDQELKRMTEPIPAATKRTILRNQVTGKSLQTPPIYVNGTRLSDMESEMNCIFDIAEHHSASPLTVMVVELG